MGSAAWTRANKLLSCAAAVENTDAFYKVSSFLSGVRDCRTIRRSSGPLCCLVIIYLIWYLLSDEIQRSAKVGAPGMVNSISVVFYHFCPSKHSQQLEHRLRPTFVVLMVFIKE